MLAMKRREGGRWGDRQTGMIQGNKGLRDEVGEGEGEGRKEGCTCRKERRGRGRGG